MKEFVNLITTSNELNLYEKFSEILSDNLLITNLKGNIIFVNKNFYNTFGYELSKTKLKLNIFQIIDIDCSDKLQNHIKASINGIKPTDNEYIAITQTGLKFNVSIEIFFPANNNSERHIYYVIKDISKRKDAEQRLIHSRRRFRLITESTSDVIWMMNLKMKETYVSPSIVLLTGYAVGEFKKMPYTNKFSPATVQTFRDIISSQINEAVLSKSYNPGYSKTFEVEYKCKNGNYIWAEVKTSILYDENDKLYGIIGVTRNITERKQAEKLLRESEKNYRQLTENINDAFWLCNLEKCLYINAASLEIWNCKAEEMYKSKSINLLNIHPDDYDRIYNVLNSKTYQKYKIFNEEYRIVNPNGRIRWIWVRNFPIYDSNNVIYRIGGIATDITEKHANEELSKNIEIAKRTAQLKQNFLSNMSHEIRTPMTGVIGMLDLLLATPLNPDQKEYAKIIKSSADSLLTILNDILILSKIEAHKLELHPVDTNLMLEINQIKQLFEPITKTKNINFNTIFTHPLPRVINVDIVRVKQIITNFISNAVKFTDKGSITIRCGIFEKNSKTLKIKIEVIDTGIGINKENQQKLFSAFSQDGSSFNRNIEGIGLGLTISKELAILMGGEVGLNSNKGEGSNFWFTFMAKIVKKNTIFEAKPNIIKNNPRTLNLNILLVEDTFINQKVIALMLQNFSCKVDIAANGLEALEKFKKKNYHLILMDIQMPKMDGIETVNILRKNYKTLPPIIGLSANAMEGDAEKYIALGMDDYLTKPILSDTLYEKILKWTKTK